MTKTVVTLEDKYTQQGGRVFMSTVQALVRLPLDQARRDAAAGVASAGFISGYRGSPLGTYDAALWGAQRLLEEHRVTFLPGLNEELAATSVRGSQQLAWFGKSAVQGVFGLWYGKGLGCDRAMEALKLGNLEGSAAQGGVLVLAGDDHGGKSSASAHQSEHALIAAFIPVLYPATPAEVLEFGLLGWSMSRYSGLYTGFKCVTDTLDFSASVVLPDPFAAHVFPELPPAPPGGLNLRQLQPPLVQEALTVNHRLPAAQAFARANGIDRVVLDSPRRELSIVTAGKACLDLRQALEDLGLDDARCATLGIRVLKIGLVWPLDPETLREFARASRELLVVEEKRPVMEEQATRILYGLHADERPAITGKHDTSGQALVSAVGELNAAALRPVLQRRLAALGLLDAALAARGAHWDEVARSADAVTAAAIARPAFFCSGCPHNTSTRIPDGSIAMSAVGCHGLAAFIPERRTLMPTPMGGDGMPWIAAGPLVDTPHIFQNMGDGTYAHSGILSIRAAVAARATMTFKILYNDAVAMTGGQPVEGTPAPLEIVAQLQAEGVAPVVLLSDEPAQFHGATRLPQGVELHHRDALDAVQRRLRELPGVSAIVYVQTCAAEKRRRRKRGRMADPDRRVFINPSVCEGCGDCSVQSNCVSIQPLETPLGRKRRIDQSSCNKDFSCLKGFCPAFVTLDGARIVRRTDTEVPELASRLAALPMPARARSADACSILITGIGGTGVLTIGALLGMAAHLDGLECSVLDQTGMAQKGGAVTSHLRIGAPGRQLFAARLGTGMSDLLIACDLVVAAGADALRTIRPGITRAVLNTDVTPTGKFQTDRDMDIDATQLVSRVRETLGEGTAYSLPATTLAARLTGDSIATNLLMLGFALQHGLLPVSLESIHGALRLHGGNVDANLRTLGLGRLLAAEPEHFAMPSPSSSPSLATVLAERESLLRAYQDEAWAAGYRAFLSAADAGLHASLDAQSRERVLLTIARTLARLMTYKDEYEVARLHADAAFTQALEAQFDGPYRLAFHLAPPLLSPRDPNTGRPRKRRFGAWIRPVFGGLQHLRKLRGTPFDPFGHTTERKRERALISEYRELVSWSLPQVHAGNVEETIALLGAADAIRGFGPVKEEAMERYRSALPALRARLQAEVAVQAVRITP